MERRRITHKGAFRVIARRVSYQLARSSVAYWRTNGEKRGLIYVATGPWKVFKPTNPPPPSLHPGDWDILCLEKCPADCLSAGFNQSRA